MGHNLFFFNKTASSDAPMIRSHATLMQGPNVMLGSYVMFSHHNITI